MGKYLKLFNEDADYKAFKETEEYILPNVSYVEDINVVYYNPYEEPKSPNLVCTYDITDISQNTQILNSYGLGSMANMIVDGIEMDVETHYQFDTVGNHVVEFVLDDPTSIGNVAFYDCKSLTSVVIPDSVTTIGNAAFSSCTGLTSITCNAITAPTISNNTFQMVNYDGVLKVPEGSDYSTWMSKNNYYLGKYNWTISFFATLPDDFEESVIMTSVSNPRAMEVCYNQGWAASPDQMLASEAYVVTNIGTAFAAANNGSGNITQPEMLEMTSFDEFQYFVNVKEISYYAFASCTGLTSIVIPDSVTTIGDQAFMECSGLTSIVIPDSVTSIGSQAFQSCSGLNEITCNAITAPTIIYAFSCVKESGILKVPVGSDYSSWMSTNYAYLGYYNWTIEYV